MTIRVYKPQEIRSLIPDEGSIRFWAVWEGTNGRHHEEAQEYDNPKEPVICLGNISRTTLLQGIHPLLTDEYTEDHEQVLPGTLRFIRIDDLLKLYRFVDPQGNIYAIH